MILATILAVILGGPVGIVLHEYLCPTCNRSRREGYIRRWEILKPPMSPEEMAKLREKARQ